MHWLELVKQLAPIVALLVPGGQVVAPFLPVILHGIGEAEALPGATGAEKRQHVVNLVGDAIAATNTVKGPPPIDPGVAMTTAGAVVDTIVGVANLVHAQHAPTA